MIEQAEYSRFCAISRAEFPKRYSKRNRRAIGRFIRRGVLEGCTVVTEFEMRRFRIKARTLIKHGWKDSPDPLFRTFMRKAGPDD